ncbi:unnamed protein product [Adineta steineri]|uniref:Uncharacterized protein n=1 Tax=Adineta steineri TaxID=433720 RepID=A0A813T6G7_9BILA|nr:unnamed protein product [Adineta steineri]
MQHKRGPENMVIMNDHYTLTTKPLAQVNDPQVQRSRRVLLIMLGICLNSFNPLNPTENLLELDDNGCSDNQFKLLIALEVNTKYILVVTTSQANVTGTFSIIVTGPTKAVLERTNISSTSISTATAFTTTTKPSYACMTYYPTWMLIMICSIINLMKKLI